MREGEKERGKKREKASFERERGGRREMLGNVDRKRVRKCVLLFVCECGISCMCACVCVCECEREKARET